MKTLVVYDSTTGEIILTMQRSELKEDYKCIVKNIDEGKIIKSVDTSTKELITKDKDTRIEDINDYIKNADDTTVSRIEDTILEVESNKTLEEK